MSPLYNYFEVILFFFCFRKIMLILVSYCTDTSAFLSLTNSSVQSSPANQPANNNPLSRLSFSSSSRHAPPPISRQSLLFLFFFFFSQPNKWFGAAKPRPHRQSENAERLMKSSSLLSSVALSFSLLHGLIQFIPIEFPVSNQTPPVSWSPPPVFSRSYIFSFYF